METRRIALCACIVAAALAAAAWAQQGAANTITGRITDLAGRPVGGAKVFVWERTADAPFTVATTSADDGSFRLGPLPAKPRHDLYVDADGYARLHVGSVPSYTRCGSDAGALALESGARLRGRIVDERGKPLAGGAIEIQTRRHLTTGCVGDDGPDRALRCAADGSFTTPALQPGDHRLRFSVAGRVAVERARSLAPGGADADLGRIALAPDTPIRGRVVGPGGKPVVGAEVYCDYDYEHATKTDAEGRFELRGHAASAEQVCVRASSFVDGQFALPADHAQVAIELRVAHQIRGRVVDAATGKPVQITEVLLCSVERHADGSVDLYG